MERCGVSSASSSRKPTPTSAAALKTSAWPCSNVAKHQSVSGKVLVMSIQIGCSCLLAC